MFSVSIDLAALTKQAEELGAVHTEAVAKAKGAIYQASMDATHENIIPATPISTVVTDRDGGDHVHMADRWTCEETPEGAVIRNPAPYADFVAEGTEFMDANPDLNRALSSLQENITSRAQGYISA